MDLLTHGSEVGMLHGWDVYQVGEEGVLQRVLLQVLHLRNHLVKMDQVAPSCAISRYRRIISNIRLDILPVVCAAEQ